MSKTEFELGDTLAAVLGNVSDPDRAPEQIVLIDLPLIDADKNNFYSMDGVEELAANIELIGLLDPLRVRENPDMPGRYLIVSGHRRRAALWTLYEENPEKWGKAPCIVEQPAASPELQELRLIYANADTRKMSSADLSAQAQRVEMLLYKLKDQGMEFPGRMRDHVAEACKVSATKLAELKVIREKLEPDWRRLWEENKINHSTAYTIAKEDPDIQRRLAFEYTPAAIESWAQWQVEQAIETVRDPKPKEKKQDPFEVFDAEVYAAQLEKEREQLRGAIRDQWLEYLCGTLSRGNLPKHRMDAIEELKRCYRNSGCWSGGDYYDYDGRPNGIEIRPPKSEKKFLARYADLFDQLALVAIGELYRRIEDEKKTPTAPAQKPAAYTNAMKPSGDWLCACKFDFSKTWQFMRWNEQRNVWKYPNTGGEVSHDDCTRWVPLSEEIPT